MKLYVFSVYDSAVEAYSPPFFARALGQATRDFIAECNNEKSRIFQSPEHYSLFQLGAFHDDSGTFECLPVPVCIARAHEHKSTGV